jgi:hypothetical protein
VLNQESIDSKRNRYEAAAKQSMPSKEENYAGSWRRIRGLMAITVMLTICFGRPLYDLAWYSLHSDLCSYIPLVPLISLYLIWSKRRSLVPASRSASRLAALPLCGGVATLAAYCWAVNAGWKPDTEDYLALITLSYLLLFLAGSFVFLGRETLRMLSHWGFSSSPFRFRASCKVGWNLFCNTVPLRLPTCCSRFRIHLVSGKISSSNYPPSLCG